MEYAPTVHQQQQPEFSPQDLALNVSVFKHGNDPIDAINHMMSFLTSVVTSRFPTTNNLAEEFVYFVVRLGSHSYRKTVESNSGNRAQANGQVLHEEELALLANPIVLEFQNTQTVITHNASYQANDLDAYDSDCDELNTAQVALIANLSRFGSNTLAEVHNMDNVNNITIQDVQKHNKQLFKNSISSVQQDSLISSVIEQLKTQVVNYTQINLNNKSVNDTLTVELERYKEQVKVLKEGQNVKITSKDKFLDLHEQNAEIDRLKQIISKQLRKKESLMKTVTVLKNDFKKEESRNIDREIALENRIKHHDNIVYKRDQSAQTIHMLTTPKFFYDHSTKQALGFQNPYYLKRAQQLEPKLYDGNVIPNTYMIEIPNSEETLMLAEESRSKLLLKQQNPIVLEKKVNTKPIDYATINKISQDFEQQFVPQTKLSAEQAFWTQNSLNYSDPSPSCTPTKVEVPKKHPKLTITKGMWGFEHTKACFRDEIIPFVKTLTDIFNNFDQYLIDELTKVQNVFKQMELAIEQHHLESKTFEDRMNQVLHENERLLEQVINTDIVNVVVNSSVDNAFVNVHECEKCLKLETELLNKKDFIEKETYYKLLKSFTTLEKHCISLEVDTQLNQEIFERDNSGSNQNAPNFNQYFELNELKAQSQEKDTVVQKLKEKIKSLSGNVNKDKVKKDIAEIETINIKLDHRVSKLITENKHLKQTYKQLYDSIKPARVRSKEQCDTLINQVNQKSMEIYDLNAKHQEQGLHSKVNANSKLICVKCNGCMLYDNHEFCVLNFVNDVHAKSKSIKKISKRKVWKPTGKVFTNIRYTWRPAGRTFTIVGNECPLTRITTTTEVPPRKPIALEIDTPKPIVTLVYSRKPKKPKTTDLIRNVTISKVYYVEGFGHNLFSVGQFYDSNLEVAFRIHTCFIRNLEGDDLLTGSQGNNMYTLSIGDMMVSSPICLLSKASKTKSWL
ncbi:hypothetical protein Tco_0281970 [Tanacetum coccineum]